MKMYLSLHPKMLVSKTLLFSLFLSEMRLSSSFQSSWTPPRLLSPRILRQTNSLQRLHCRSSCSGSIIKLQKIEQLLHQYTYSKYSSSSSRLFSSSSDSASSLSNQNKITEKDIKYMNQALEAAQLGVGNTYPNPAVGCVLVENQQSCMDEVLDDNGDNDKIIGVGFHPKAGYPHAEIFALFEACGYVDNGIEAAQAVVNQTKKSSSSSSSQGGNSDTIQKVDELLQTYSKSTPTSREEGARILFENKFKDKKVTAYVTLEPCCHYGQTPPCALTFVLAGVDRVVIGYRDPNPRVDGGGVTMLQNEGVEVDLMTAKLDDPMEDKNEDRNKSAIECANIVKAFAKRITPRNEKNGGEEIMNYESSMNGAKRSALRNLAGRWKKENIMIEFEWPSYFNSVQIPEGGELFDFQSAIEDLTLDHGWLEKIDNALWEKELILLRLSNAVAKKKGAKILGERIANELNAHVAQVVGHTALLYRPGLPPILDLDEMVAEK